ncbi:MAG: hypothetical protein F6K24_20135 [Okeania sp. SIO2D1]|nr:hypothetical protein [Okeania sp. SIO2D1]
MMMILSKESGVRSQESGVRRKETRGGEGESFCRGATGQAQLLPTAYCLLPLRGCLRSLICYITRPRASPAHWGTFTSSWILVPPRIGGRRGAKCCINSFTLLPTPYSLLPTAS